MFRLLWRLSRGYRLRPWRSPYLRWRIETYSGMHAETIGFREFWRFTWRSRRELASYLLWAAAMAKGLGQMMGGQTAGRGRGFREVGR